MKNAICLFALFISLNSWASAPSIALATSVDVNEVATQHAKVVSMTPQQMFTWLTTQHPGIWGASFGALTRNAQEARIEANLPIGESFYNLDEDGKETVIVDLLVQG